MLEKVRLIWIKGGLEPSLYHLARMELGLETKPDAVARPFDLLVQRPEQVSEPPPTGIPISRLFDEEGNALLILGEPGAGKTTLLLELTRDLLDRAAQDENHVIPVVFNMSSWAEQKLALADWLIDELNKRYDVPRQLATTWMKDELIFPLLDGLDEVAAEHREACVESINVFLNEHGLLPMVVCSRVADYEALTGRLRLPSAVMIQSLSRQQVTSYVEQAGAPLAGLSTVLQADESLWELLNTPLTLSIAALAYRGRSPDEICSSGTRDEHRTHLFAAYTDAMFHRRAKTVPYTQEQTEHWLTWLARTMQAHNQSVLYLEWMQPDWVPRQNQQRLITCIVSVMSGLVFGLVFGLCFGLFGGLSTWLGGKLFFGLFVGLIFGLFFGLFGGLIGGMRSPLAVGLVFGLVAGLVFGLVAGLDDQPVGGLIGGIGSPSVAKLVSGLVVGLFSWLVVGLFSGLVAMLAGYSKEIKPIEKIQWSVSALRDRWKINFFKGLVFGLVFGLIAGISADTLRDLLFVALIFGLSFGLASWLRDGFTIGEIGPRSFPNEGIRRSVRNAFISGLTNGLLAGLISGLGGGLLFNQLIGLFLGLFLGLLFGLSSWLYFGGHTCLLHLALRLVLWHKNYAPFNYVRFLDYATARIFLRKVGGGYVFVHRMLLEYFASRDQTSAE